MVSGATRGSFQNQFSIFTMKAERYTKLPNSCSKSAEEKRNECTSGCSNAAAENKGGAESL
jgi:hypothetical protein